MNKQILKLVALVGALGGGYALWSIKPGVTIAQLQDAGVPAGVLVAGVCDVFIPYECAVDAGMSLTKGGDQYARMRFRAREMPGKNILFRPNDCAQIVDPKSCDRAATQAEDTDDGRTVTQKCVCRKGSGLCRYQPKDGGLPVNIPLGVTAGPGTRWGPAAGAGCMPKSCREAAGTNSWPNIPDGGALTDGCPL